MSRHAAREEALQALFQMDMRDISAQEALEHMEITCEGNDRVFLFEIVQGTWKNREFIDGVIRQFSKDWRLERIAIVDRNILRLAIYEMFFRKDIPETVSINEAVELAKAFGSAESGKFVNGILGEVLKNMDILMQSRNGDNYENHNGD